MCYKYFLSYLCCVMNKVDPEKGCRGCLYLGGRQVWLKMSRAVSVRMREVMSW